MTFERDELAKYDTAISTIGNVRALASQHLADERKKAKPNEAHITYLRNWQGHLLQVQRGLTITDHAAVSTATATYAQILKNRSTAPNFPLELPIWTSRGFASGLCRGSDRREAKP